jgi:SAM-dependent methyltransferase
MARLAQTPERLSADEATGSGQQDAAQRRPPRLPSRGILGQDIVRALSQTESADRGALNCRQAANSTMSERVNLLRMRAHVVWGIIRRRGSKFVTSYLAGLKGIEIGAASHNRFFLDAVNVDRYPGNDTIYKKEERKLVLHAAKVDVVAPGDELPFEEDSVDFVFASHVIEHFPDPIRALYEWNRVARRYVVLVVPHRDRTFDSERELSTVEELLQRHRQGFSSEEDKHWSVWTRESFIELCQAAGLRVLDSLDPDDKVGNGFAIVLDASAAPEPRIPAPPKT